MKKIFTASLCALFLTSFSLNAQDCLVGDFPFFGDATDYSTSEIDGTVSGAALTSDRFSELESAYSFDGVDDKIIAGTDNRGITDKLTISAWVKTTSTTNAMIVGKYDYNVDAGYHLMLVDNIAFLGGRNKSEEYVSLRGVTVINDGEWHHIAGVCDGPFWQLYVDGEAEAQYVTGFTGAAFNYTTNVNFGIGYNSQQNNSYFKGAIDDVTLYNCALNADEISALIATSTIAEKKANTQVSVFPIPSNSIVNIETNSNDIASLEVVNAQGITMINRAFENQLNISGLTQGIYVILMKDENGNIVSSKRIVKE